MTLKQYLIFMTLGSVLCWVAWFFLIWTVDPTDSGPISFIFFYLSFALAIIGTVSVLGFLVRRLVVKNDDVMFRHVKRTFRQSLFVAVWALSILVLSAYRLMAWWSAIPLTLLFIMMELIIFTKRKYSNLDYV